MIEEPYSFTLPWNWLCDITKNNSSIIVQTFFILSQFNEYNIRVVEKQFVLLLGT
jgi:hypothetical protein